MDAAVDGLPAQTMREATTGLRNQATAGPAATSSAVRDQSTTHTEDQTTSSQKRGPPMKKTISTIKKIRTKIRRIVMPLSSTSVQEIARLHNSRQRSIYSEEARVTPSLSQQRSTSAMLAKRHRRLRGTAQAVQVEDSASTSTPVERNPTRPLPASPM